MKEHLSPRPHSNVLQSLEKGSAFSGLRAAVLMAVMSCVNVREKSCEISGLDYGSPECAALLCENGATVYCEGDTGSPWGDRGGDTTVPTGTGTGITTPTGTGTGSGTGTGTSGTLIDSDGDGLTDGEEALLGTDPNNPDTDYDGLSDGAEVNLYGTNPLSGDTDSDGLGDEDEILTFGSNPLVPDTDYDGLSDRDEVSVGTDLNDPDTDNDGLNDGAEIAAGTSPFLPDTDGDGLMDEEELSVYGTDPLNPDTDADTLSDGDEVNTHGTDPNLWDTDGDGFSDSQEINVLNSDPRDSSDPVAGCIIEVAGEDSKQEQLIQAPLGSFSYTAPNFIYPLGESMPIDMDGWQVTTVVLTAGLDPNLEVRTFGATCPDLSTQLEVFGCTPNAINLFTEQDLLDIATEVTPCNDVVTVNIWAPNLINVQRPGAGLARQPFKWRINP